MFREEVYLVSEKLRLVQEGDINRIKSALGVVFPPGYEEYVTELGQGIYGGLVQILIPELIVEELEAFQRYENGIYARKLSVAETSFDVQDVMGSIPIAKTNQGDTAVFDPYKRNRMYVLPRQDMSVYAVNGGVMDLLDWIMNCDALYQARYTRILSDSGDLIEGRVRYFKSFVDRVSERLHSNDSISFRAIRELLIHTSREDMSGYMYTEDIWKDGEGYDRRTVRLFMRECYGEVLCIPGAQESGELWIIVEYDTERKTVGLQQLLDYFGSIDGMQVIGGRSH